MQRPLICAGMAGLLALGAAIGIIGCDGGDRAGGAAPRRVDAPDYITLFYTCDTRGHIDPCKCTSGPAGGLARRATFIARQRKGDTLIVDAGNLTAGPRPPDVLELEYILRGYDAIGYQAVNIGKREVGLPVQTLKDLGARFTSLVSANVQDAQGKLIFPPFRVATLDSGYRVAVVGAVSDALQPDEIGEGVTILPLREALTKALPAAKAAADAVVLAVFAKEQTMKDLAEQYFELAVIVGGDVEQPSGTAIMTNKSIVVYETDKGKSVGQLTMRYVGVQYVAEDNAVTSMTDEFPDDPKIAALVNEMHRKWVEKNYPKKPDDEEELTPVK